MPAGSIITAFSAIGAFFTSLGVVGNLLLSAGLSLLSQALIGRPKKPQFSINTQLRAGGEVPRSIGFGNYITAGSLVYANTWGEAGKTPNAYLTQVIALADIPNVSLTNFIVDANYVTIGATEDGDFGFPIEEYNDDGKDHLWIKFYNGTQTTADPLLVNEVASTERPYGSDRVGRGVAYAVVTARVNQELFSSIPQFRFQLRGRIYDPRKDSTVGGSGSHRINDITTWGNGPEADNPVVQIYNILRGINFQGQWLYGLQRMSPNQLPLADWFAQMDKAETSVTEASGPVAQYRSGGEIPVDAPIADIIDNILTTCSGRLSEVGGAYKIKVGAPDASVVSFTDDDVVSTSAQVFSPFFGLADLVNGIEASYPDPEQVWNMQAAPPLFSPSDEEEDGNRRLMAQVDMLFSPYPEQVQRLMKQALLDARKSRQHAITLGPRFWPLEPGDIITWTSDRNGYNNKLFRVDAISDLSNGDVVVNITEVDPSDYDWNSGTEFNSIPGGNLGLVVLPPIIITQNEWSVLPTSLLDANGTARIPAIRLQWPTDYDNIDRVEFQVRLASDESIVTNGFFGDYPSGFGIITEGILPETNYQVRGRLIDIEGQKSEWTDWMSVTTDSTFITTADIGPAVITFDNFANDVTSIFNNIEGDIEDIETNVNSLSSTVGSNTTTITQVSQSVNGIQGRYGVTIDNNGNITGYQLLSGSGGSAFNVRADQFAVFNNTGAGGDNPFTIFTSPRTINGVTFPAGTYIRDAFIDNAAIVNLSVGTIKIQNNAVSAARAASTTTTSSSTSWTTLASITFTPTNPSGQIVVWGRCRGVAVGIGSGEGAEPSQPEFGIRLRWRGSVISSTNRIRGPILVDNSQSWETVGIEIAENTLGSGSGTVELQVINFSGNITMQDATLICSELKK